MKLTTIRVIALLLSTAALPAVSHAAGASIAPAPAPAPAAPAGSFKTKDAAAAAATPLPCKKITDACIGAGYTASHHASGQGIGDCLSGLVSGKTVQSLSTHVPISIDPKYITACNAARPAK